MPVISFAGQIAVEELRAAENVSPEFAKSFTPLLLETLRAIPKMAVVSEHDMRALVATRPSLKPEDCQPERCLLEISDNLESEFFLSGTLGRMGRKWVASLTLTHLDQNRIIRHATGARTGNADQAPESLLNAIQNLFRDQLPPHLIGPRSLSRLGYEATVLGFSRGVRTAYTGVREHRKRLILDLVNTELEYDVAPKIDILDNVSRNEIAALKVESLLATTPEAFQQYLWGQQLWRALREDLNRVRELRAKARTLGLTPSAQALRFEAPASLEWPPQVKIEAYRAAAAQATETVNQLITGWNSADAASLGAAYSQAHPTALNYRRALREKASLENPTHFEIVAMYNLSPRMLEIALDALSRGELLVYLAQFKGAEIESASRVFLIREGETWKVRHW